MSKHLNWVIKGKSTSDKDVSISLVKSGDSKVASITIRNNVEKSITTTEHLIVAVDGTRLYFKGATKELGYKLAKKSQNLKNSTTQIKDKKIVEFATYHSGDYPIKFDKDLKLFFVDTE